MQLNQYFHSVFSNNPFPSLPLLCEPDFQITKQGVLKLIVNLQPGKATGSD